MITAGIDATNIRGGGGVTHLVEMLRGADPSEYGIDRVVVWSGLRTLSRIEERAWLTKVHCPVFERSIVHRGLWQWLRLGPAAAAAGCAIVLVPGGSYAAGFHPVVTMSQNLLPFDDREIRRYGLRLMRLKLNLLRLSQSRGFKRSEGVIFLTKFAEASVRECVGALSGETCTIPHGVDQRFFRDPRPSVELADCSASRPFRLTYVSIVDLYKHQWNVAEAVVRLGKRGLPVFLDLVGPSYPPAAARLQKVLAALDPERRYVRYTGPVAYDEMHRMYMDTDLVVFASSCENLPNILIEGMASGLPVACSNRGPMPEVLGDAGEYFDPESVDSIERAIGSLMHDHVRRRELAARAFARANAYSWEKCAVSTWEFLAGVANRNRRH